MLKPIAAGLFCLGIVTLGVTASRGEDDEGKLEVDLVVVGEEEKPAAEVRKKAEPAGENVFEIRIGEDGNARFTSKGEKKDAEGGEGIQVIIQNEEGKQVRKIHGKREAIGVEGRARVALPTIDSETRQALDKLITGLKDETKRLEAAGKKEEAEKKLQSIRALEQLLNPAVGWKAMSLQPTPQGGGINFVVRTAEEGPANEETKRRADRLQKLQAEESKIKEGDHEAREKLQRLRAELEKTVAERQRRKIVAVPAAPGTPFPPGTPMLPGQPMNVPPGGGFGAPGVMVWTAGGNPAADMLSRQAAALTEASAKLKAAGLEQQSQELHGQAEKLKAQAEKLRAATAAQPNFGPWGAGGFAGGPPMQLQQSIHELQEQVQQLRNEIGELRELLQRRP